MNELENIRSVLQAAGRRRRLQRALNGLAEGALAGAVLFIVTLTAYKLLPVPVQILPWTAAAAGFCALAGVLRRAWRRESPEQTARWIDEQAKLKERLSTAWEVSPPSRAAAASPPSEWQRLVLADAARHAASLDLRQLGRLTLPRLAGWAAVIVVLAAGLGFVPEYRTKAFRQQQQDTVVIRDAGRSLTELTRRELAQKPAPRPEVQKSLEEIATLGETLEKQSLTKAEALRDLASATEKLARQEQQITHQVAYRKLEQAARQPGNAANATAESMRRQIDALQKELGAAADKAKQLDQLGRDLQKLRQDAANAANNQGPAGEAARQQLATSLAELARQAQEAGASLDDLEHAIEALKGNQIDQFVKDLDLASHDLEKLQEKAKAMQQLQQQLNRMGKDLGEQLQYGQAQAAIQSLERMIRQLQSGGPKPEQLQQMLEELKNAARPAEDYGAVAEHLKKALQEGRAGDKAATAKSLAAAQDELRKLLEQMQDGEGLQAALAALERAQAAVASGQLWSQARPAGQCKSCNGQGCARCNGTGKRWGHGGRPGRGVGTWAEEDYGWTHFDQEHGEWEDNSGLQRPNLDPRGVADRPADLNPNLIPDKVKGRMAPGGSMPSITLKGVSIKGTSNVKFEEAATAAQQDAESALSQDRVPRAYQNAVRDYFDDLKK